MDHLGFRGANARKIVPFHTHISVLIEVLPQPAGVRQDEAPARKIFARRLPHSCFD
jgi:hypothetical protein